ncbi:MAG TPA: pitrilysin family protein [Pyrinomonadaceae bacterium]|jgi:predicted Zn-dependent peptidase|nr:pitrilysin family protein [Pyrinomonadaceae bacterium]
MKKNRQLVASLALMILIASGLPVHAQKLDRTVIPPAGKSPELRVPAWTKAVLPNGSTLIVSERPGLPLVSFSVTFIGGSNQFEPAGRRGLGTITGSMLSEGTTTKTGDQLSDALQTLGTNVGINIGAEEGSMNFVSTTRNFDATLALLADMMLNPTFPAPALERLRGRTLVGLTAQKDQPTAVGAQVFAKILYGSSHPYGQRATEASIKAITRDDVVAFQKAYFQPGRAIITVVGDVKTASVKASVEKAFASWSKAGEKPSFDYPKLPERQPATIYLVDKPGAAQSVVNIGVPGPPRNTPDYFALQVLNTILGGQFQSRLNANIREQKGYSYGVSSNFAYGKGPGAFRAGGNIFSDKTDAALTEFMKELKGIVGERPITDEELKTAKDALIQGLPQRFASVSAIGNSINGLMVQGLPENYYQNYAKAVSAVTKEDLTRVANLYIDINHLAIVIVGDRSTVEARLKALNIAPITILDLEGNPVSESTGSAKPGN